MVTLEYTCTILEPGFELDGSKKISKEWSVDIIAARKARQSVSKLTLNYL
jgi:hypothetical protein